MSNDYLDSEQHPSVATLEWSSIIQPPLTYSRVKGIPESSLSGYTLVCDIFRGADTPHPDLGETSDIYIDGAAGMVFAKLETQDARTSWVQWTHVSSRIVHPLFPVFELTAQRSLGIKWSTTNAVRIAKTRGHLPPSIKMAIEKTYETFPHLLSPITRRNHQECKALSRPPSPVPKSSSHTSASPSIVDTLEQSFIPDPEQEWLGIMDSEDEFSSPEQSPGHDAEQEWHGFVDSADGVTPSSPPVVPPTRSLVAFSPYSASKSTKDACRASSKKWQTESRTASMSSKRQRMSSSGLHP